MHTVMVTSAAPTRDLSADDLSLLNVLHSDPTSITLCRCYRTHTHTLYIVCTRTRALNQTRAVGQRDFNISA